MAVAFANIFMAKVETEISNQSALKPLVWKRFIDDIFSLWNRTREVSHSSFNKLTNNIKLEVTVEVSETQTNLLDTTVYKGERFETESVLNVCTHFKPTETFQYTQF